MLDFYLDPQFVAEADTKDSWLRLLERPWNQSDRPVAISVGPEAGLAWTSVATVQIERINTVLTRSRSSSVRKNGA